MWRKPHWTAISLGFVLIAALPGVSGAAGYKLGVQDKIRVKVYEWHNSVGAVHRWNGLNGDFTVGADGTVSLPLLGNMRAAGRTTQELGRTISARLQKMAGLASSPDTAIEIESYRPFYILGNVNKPGSYAYRPDMTVLQAVSIAGGLFRPADLGLLQFQQTSLQTAGNLRVLQLQYNRLVARRAAVQALLSGKPRIDFPAELAQSRSNPEIAQLLQQEEQVFDSRRDAFRRRTEDLNQRRKTLVGELQSLNRQMHNEDQELALLRQEVARTVALVKRGLAVAPRAYALEANEIEAQNRRLTLDTAVLQAKDAIGKIDDQLLALESDRRQKLLDQQQETDGQLSQLAEEMRTKQLLIEQDQMVEPELARAVEQRSADSPYTIVRQADGRVQQIAATETTPVEPGDTIKIGGGEAAAAVVADHAFEDGALPGAEPTSLLAQ